MCGNAEAAECGETATHRSELIAGAAHGVQAQHFKHDERRIGRLGAQLPQMARQHADPAPQGRGPRHEDRGVAWECVCLRERAYVSEVGGGEREGERGRHSRS
jgi:hypothetical protein